METLNQDLTLNQESPETKAEWSEYVVVYMINGERKYYKNNQGDSAETFFTNKLRLADTFYTKEDALDSASTMTEVLKLYMEGVQNISAEVKEIKMSAEMI